ncbi:MAG: hypothetical protein IPO85_11980 [Saprospiraceae bacterium]|uniref:Uncharacterized protein n=1 Tax=Candidatus Defluviibacterium haderslevense TaxID=2981993 RepID=A0A9D7SAF9_9BACT|nr:hypothetical protein [Candidatus Defluviibacterium haderslevense]
MKLNIILLTILPLFTINSQIVEFIGSSGGPLGEQKGIQLHLVLLITAQLGWTNYIMKLTSPTNQMIVLI